MPILFYRWQNRAMTLALAITLTDAAATPIIRSEQNNRIFFYLLNNDRKFYDKSFDIFDYYLEIISIYFSIS